MERREDATSGRDIKLARANPSRRRSERRNEERRVADRRGADRRQTERRSDEVGIHAANEPDTLLTAAERDFLHDVTRETAED
jgi:hypothetical protein